MKLVWVRTKQQKKEYLDFLYQVYREDPKYCDMNVIFVKDFLYRRDPFAKRCRVLPFYIRKEGKVICEGIYVLDDTREIKLSFLEFLPEAKDGLEKLHVISQKLMKRYQKQKTILGVNGQISFGLGFLTDRYNRDFEFNANYHPAYYTKMLDEVFPCIKRAFSYSYDAKKSLAILQDKFPQMGDITIRTFDMLHFKRDMLTFGRLCHESLKSTPYYGEKTPYEMYVLMKKMRMMMRREDILFAMKDQKEIGFVYTHPDYAEFFRPGRINYVTFYLRFLFQRPKKVIYNVIGVLPEYQKTGVALKLIYESIRIRQKMFPTGASSFILEDNVPSNTLCSSMATGINKEYHLYEIEAKHV